MIGTCCHALQVTEAPKESPLQVAATATEQVPAIVAFAARYYSGGPFQDPVQVLLKVQTASMPHPICLHCASCMPCGSDGAVVCASVMPLTPDVWKELQHFQHG